MSKARHDDIRMYSQTRVLKGDDYKFRASLSKMVRPNPPPISIPQKKWNECWVLLSYIWHIKYSINIKFIVRIPSWLFFFLQDRVSHLAFNSLASWGKHSVPLSLTSQVLGLQGVQPVPTQPVSEVVITALWVLILTGKAKVLESPANLPP